AAPYLIGPSGVPGGAIALVGFDPAARLMNVPLSAGRWIEPGDLAGAVINPAVVARYPTLGVGDSVRVRIGGRTVAFAVVGIDQEVSPMPLVYAARTAVAAATGEPLALSRSVQIVTRRHTAEAQRDVARALEREFERRGIEVAGLQRMLDAKQAILDHLV